MGSECTAPASRLRTCTGQNTFGHVRFDPPALTGPPGELNLTFIKGNESPTEIVFETIETKQSDNWITGFEVNPPRTLDSPSLHVDELPEADPSLVRRRYHVQLANRSLDIGKHAATLTLRTRQDASAAPAPVPLVVTVVDPVAIVPNPVVITSGEEPQPRRVHVVYRAGEGAASLVEYDERLLRMEPVSDQGGRALAFDIVPITTPERALETRAVFRVADGETRELVIRFEPFESPAL